MLGLVLGRVSQAVSEEVHHAALPGAASTWQSAALRLGGRPRPRADSVEATLDERAQQLAPERLGLGRADVEADDLAAARLVDGVRHPHTLAHDAAAGADALDLRVDEQVGVAG